MRVRALALALVISPVALAEDAAPALQRGELGVRYWLSTGETKNSHNAQGAAPILGNPTSVLLYENLDAHVVELNGWQGFGDGWFIKGNLGIGRINTGSFDDEDYFVGQVKFSDTTSSVPAGKLSYGTFDIGRNQWALQQGRSAIGVFIGYSQWTEVVDAYGATDHLGFIGGDISRDVKVLSNKATWKSLRLGFAADLALGERSRLVADLAYIPYSKVRNEDSHHLRPDLGPVPNVIKEGVGTGVHLDVELRYAIYRRTTLGAGLRYWRLQAEHGTDNTDFPLVELYSERAGVTFTLTRTW